MKARLGYYASAIWFVAFVAASPIGAPANPITAPPPQTPQASPAALAPIGDDQSPTPAATGAGSPKLLGRIFVSASCNTFVDRFNVAARTMISDDARLDDATMAVREYEYDFSRLDGAEASWNHRLRLIAALNELLVTIPKTQAAVNDLRGQANVATDLDRREALRESASQLQESIDRQRVVANEMLEVVDMMLDMHTAEDTVGHAAGGILDPKQGFSVDPLDDPVPHPGDGLPVAGNTYVSGLSSIEVVLRMPRDRQIISNSESNAAAAASRVVRSCSQEAPSPAGR